MIQSEKTGRPDAASPAIAAVFTDNGFLCVSVPLWFMHYRFLD